MTKDYNEQAKEAREYLEIAEALLEKEIEGKDRAKLEIFVGLLEGIESRCQTLAELPDEERRRWIAGKEAKELKFLEQVVSRLPGTNEEKEFIVTNPEAVLYAWIEIMNEKYGGK